MVIQKTLDNQNNLEKEQQRRKNHALWPQITLLSYSNQDSMVLAQKQRHYGQLTYAQGSKNIQREKTVSSISGAGNTGHLDTEEWN